jgi:hypothetical protein
MPSRELTATASLPFGNSAIAMLLRSPRAYGACSLAFQGVARTGKRRTDPRGGFSCVSGHNAFGSGLPPPAEWQLSVAEPTLTNSAPSAPTARPGTGWRPVVGRPSTTTRAPCDGSAAYGSTCSTCPVMPT